MKSNPAREPFPDAFWVGLIYRALLVGIAKSVVRIPYENLRESDL